MQNENKILRKIAGPVTVGDITKPKIQKIIHDMKDALDSQDDGVAIAAPQIAVPLRIFVVSGRIFDEDFIQGKELPSQDKNGKMKVIHPDIVFINPIFRKISKDKKLMSEGCLSVRPLYGKVRRATRATIEAYNEQGKKFIREDVGLLAHIFQHEMDHLNGILFTDKAKNLHESTPEEEFK